MTLKVDKPMISTEMILIKRIFFKKMLGSLISGNLKKKLRHEQNFWQRDIKKRFHTSLMI